MITMSYQELVMWCGFSFILGIALATWMAWQTDG